MDSQLIQNIYVRAKDKKARVVLPEGDDPRVLQAARRMLDEGLATPIVLGKPDDISDATSIQVGQRIFLP